MKTRKCGYILFLFLLMKGLNIFVEAQQPAKDKDFMRIAKTSDALYIINDRDKYLMSKSPLSSFEGYKNVYDSTLNLGLVRFFPPQPELYGIINEKRYQAIWLIKNKQLFLCNVTAEFADHTDEGEKQLFSLMEEFTNRKFFPHITGEPLPTDIHGLLPAAWFTDTLYVKKAFRQRTDDSLEDWKRRAYLRLIFEKGKLIHMEDVPNEIRESKVSYSSSE